MRGLLRGAALRAEIKRLVAAPVVELPRPEDSWSWVREKPLAVDSGTGAAPKRTKRRSKPRMTTGKKG